MSLIDRLEKAAKKYDSRARRSAVADNYDWAAADLREMLEEAAVAVRLVELFKIQAALHTLKSLEPMYDVRTDTPAGRRCV